MVDALKVHEVFPNESVFKDRKLAEVFKAKALPAFIRDWVLAKKADATGQVRNMPELHDYLSRLYPRQGERQAILDEARENGSSRKFLARVEVRFDVAKNMVTFAIPDLSLDFKETMIEDYVWRDIRDKLLTQDAAGGWGIVRLGYNPPQEDGTPGKVTLSTFQSFCPYQVNLDYYREGRRQFTIDEWMDVLLGAIDYRSEGYADWDQKHASLSRLLPFVQPNLNLMELAPKGTGKSYMYGTISKYGWLVSGGVISRAKLIFDQQKRQPGLISRTDYVAIDEIQRTRFDPPDEMQSSLQGYMEAGEVGFGGLKVAGNAGIVLLGNVDIDEISDDRCMVAKLPPFFQSTAFLDRFHGILLGTRIPRMHEDLKMDQAWGLNTEYFVEILHHLRSDTHYNDVVNTLIHCQSSHADTRDVTAVRRLCIGYLKLLYPHVLSPEDIDPVEFRRYCLAPAVRMRQSVRCQQKLLEPQEFGERDLPVFEVNPLYAR